MNENEIKAIKYGCEAIAEWSELLNDISEEPDAVTAEKINDGRFTFVMDTCVHMIKIHLDLIERCNNKIKEAK